MKSVTKILTTSYEAICRRSYTFWTARSSAILLILGGILLLDGLSQMSLAQTNTFSKANYNDDLVQNAVGNLFCLIEGAFGALIMVVAGLGAIIAAAMGAYRAAVGMLVVAVGAFILRALVSLFFGTDYAAYSASGTSEACQESF